LALPDSLLGLLDIFFTMGERQNKTMHLKHTRFKLLYSK